MSMHGQLISSAGHLRLGRTRPDSRPPVPAIAQGALQFANRTSPPSVSRKRLPWSMDSRRCILGNPAFGLITDFADTWLTGEGEQVFLRYCN